MKQTMLLICAAAIAGCGETTESEGEQRNQALASGEPVTNAQSTIIPAAVNAVEYANLTAGIDQAEIQAAELALQTSQNAAVREYAEMIIRDHRQSSAQLQQAEQEAQLPPRVPVVLADIEALRDLSGTEFDRRYLVEQVAAHERAAALAQSHIDNGRDQVMLQHAQNAREIYLRHHDAARDLAQTIQQQ